MMKGQPYYKCPDCDTVTGRCMLYGHPCGTMRCDGKPDAYQPDEDREGWKDCGRLENPIQATNIKWDTDGEDVELPSEIIIPNGMTDVEEISDYITEITGFCHLGFDLEYRNQQLCRFSRGLAVEIKEG